MLRNNLKMAWRQLLKNRYITMVNLVGLIVGMTAAMFIWQYVHFERSYDNFHEKKDRIYRVRTDRVKDGIPFMQFAGGAACAGPVIARNFPEVEAYVKLTGSSEAVFTDEKNNTFTEDKVYYAMPSLFDIFSFDILQGEKEKILTEPFTACLSRSTAKKIFGDENPIGKTLTRNGDSEYKITGVFEDIEENSHIKFEILLSYITFSDVFNEGGESETSPYWDGFFTYLLLKPGTDWKALEEKIPGVLEKEYDEEARASVAFYLQPLSDIHLTSNYLIEAELNGDGNAVRFLFIICFLVLVIAWFNYINLSTARSEGRAKEVGVRKVIGSSKKGLISQFLTESALISFIAIVISLALVQLLHPLFINLIDKDVPLSIFSRPELFILIIGLLILGTLLAGLYPAFLLSSFSPGAILKPGLGRTASGGTWLRKGLVIVQFVASVGLIASTLIIFRQLEHMQDKDLGVEIDQKMIVQSPIMIDSTFTARASTFKQEIEKISEVSHLSSSTSVPGQSFSWTAGGIRLINAPEEESESFHAMAGDRDFTKVYGMELIAGRHMSVDMGSDYQACMLNEKGVSLLKFKSPEEALGKAIYFWGDTLNVVGVLKNFHQESPKSAIEPLIFRALLDEWRPAYYTVQLKSEGFPQTIAAIKDVYANVFPGNPFNFFFLDEHFAAQYEQDKRFGKIFTLFSALAIFVSCLGLFALIAFVVERKRKEIGIRKILGASIASIMGLLSMDFMRLVFIALLIATPISWYFMNGWLDNFAVRIIIPWWGFAIAGFIAILIAFTTISFQSFKAAVANPVESLRNE